VAEAQEVWWKIFIPFCQKISVRKLIDVYFPLSDIQGDSGGICNTLGNDSMCDSKQKSSYEHGSDFERLRSYDHLNLRIEGNDYWQ